MRTMPRTVLELGPGASIGTGIAAMLSGVERYVGVDAVALATPAANDAVFDELVALAQRRAPRPAAGFPAIDAYLDERLYPAHILDEARLAAALAPERLASLRAAVAALGTATPHPAIRYLTWNEPHAIAAGEIDLVFSHVVLNHVEDLDALYASCARWIAPGGWMSHQIDFTSLETTPEWNGHRRYGELAWKVLSGRRAFFVNREVFSTHLALMRRHGFEVVRAIRGVHQGGLARDRHAPRWRDCSHQDLATQTGFVIARRAP
jgi:hypothetical protein